MEFIAFISEHAHEIRKITLSDLEKAHEFSKLTFQFINTPTETYIQQSYVLNNQAFHKNYDLDLGLSIINEQFLSFFRQAFVQLASKDVQFIKVGSKIKKIETQNLKPQCLNTHNRKKNLPYQEGVPVPFLVEVGIMDSNGKIKAKMLPKFKQVNHFLELCTSELIEYKKKHNSFNSIDIGCGKGYLTFALYDYLKKLGYENITILGIDLKKEVVENNNLIAKKCNMPGLKFISEDANLFQSEVPVNCLIALHACNNATDMAIKLALKWKVELLYLAPCCHQHLLHQIKNESMTALLKYGILKERFSALLTDALRASYLENHGYDVEVAEFVDREDSLKNILIKAVLKKNKSKISDSEYKSLKNLFKLTPWLEEKSNQL